MALPSAVLSKVVGLSREVGAPEVTHWLWSSGEWLLDLVMEIPGLGKRGEERSRS